ncbi:MAG TPA: hypothetical protein VKU01_13635 [Bryobacteraceae bacterium]|nr:hypothetical protein [Bryobacteraceae bacterium]
MHSLFSAYSRLAVHRKLAITFCGVFPLVLRLLALPWYPIPVPAVHDEFSYLLAADTFAMGRLTNPTPPLWVHFETFHELMRPTYMSMYPPGQGAMLALGKVLFGHPWWAVWLSVGVMCAALTWMLYAWLEPGWALLGGILAALQFGVAHYWINGYWGGSLAAIGGCLVLGAFGRLRNDVTIGQGLLLGVGAGILANTRPLEGLILVGIVLILLCGGGWPVEGWSRRFRLPLDLTGSAPAKPPAPLTAKALLRLILAVLATSLPLVAFTIMFNKAVTGSVLDFPHSYGRKDVAPWSVWVWEPPTQGLTYHHEVMKDFYTNWEPNYEDAKDWGTLAGLIPGLWQRGKTVGACYFPNVCYLPFALASFLVMFSPRVRWLGIVVIFALAGGMLVRWLVPHYLAPILGALMAIHLEFLRYVRSKSPRAFVALLAFLAILFAWRIVSRAHDQTNAWAIGRARIIRQLESEGRRHLVLVRYLPHHIPQQEWVFNGPDIPSQKVIFAREMTPAQDQELLDYFRNRIVWMLDADANPPVLRQLR